MNRPGLGWPMEFRPRFAELPIILQLIMDYLVYGGAGRLNPNAGLVPGGPLGIQVEAWGFRHQEQADALRQNLLVGLKGIEGLEGLGKVQVSLVSGCCPPGHGICQSYVLRKVGRADAECPPFVFSVYGPDQDAAFTDWRLLVTPLPKPIPSGDIILVVSGHRPADDTLPSCLQQIYGYLHGPNTRFVSGGPLGIQIETKGLHNVGEVEWLFNNLCHQLRLELPELIRMDSDCRPEPGWLPGKVDLRHCYQLGAFPFSPEKNLPSVFSLYHWPGDEIDPPDFRLLVTPLPGAGRLARAGESA
ncbi:MAG: hypothetical protein ABIJ46_04840 [bacterium]